MSHQGSGFGVKSVAERIRLASSEDEAKKLTVEFLRHSLDDMSARIHKGKSDDSAKAIMRDIDMRWLALSSRTAKGPFQVPADMFREFICNEAPSLANDMGWVPRSQLSCED